MIKSTLTAVCRFQLMGCQSLLKRINNGFPAGILPSLQVQQLHLTKCSRVLDKDHPAKKETEKMRKQEEQLPQQHDVDPLKQGEMVGFMFPTRKTHSMLIDNVRFDELPIIHIKATHNNTQLAVTNGKGVTIARESGGSVGFRNARKSTTIAAQAAAISIAQKSTKKGIKLVRISMKGIGPGRLPAIKALQMSGLTIISITDATPLPHNGLRPKKQRVL